MAVVALVLASHLAKAEPAVNERLLGMSEQVVKNAFPAVLKMARPARGPHGERGLLYLPNSDLAGQRVEAVFYFRGNSLQRIEQRWTAQEPLCTAAYATLMSDLNAKYGTGVQSELDPATGGQAQSSGWISSRFRVMAHGIQRPERCDLLVAFEPHQEIDASQL